MGEQYAARLVDLYDADNPDGPDHDYYRELAARHAANSILDLGCGTGILTVTFAGPGRQVTGVDPSAAMLDYARRRPGAQAVRWVHGDSPLLPDGPYDLMVMTGNVAQHIADPQWQRTLSDLRARAAAGAVLAFESRNPAARAWETWGQRNPKSGTPRTDRWRNGARSPNKAMGGSCCDSTTTFWPPGRGSGRKRC